MAAFRQPFRGEWPISQRYGEAITSSFHTGIDYACPTGTAILASADGQVTAAGWDMTGYGYRAIINHGSGRATLYAHLDQIQVRTGERVKQGQQIGLSGATGNVTGPHLHFEARKHWNDPASHFDPMQLPLTSVDDSLSEEPTEPEHPMKPVRKGICKVVCGAAYVRRWDNLSREKLVYKGETVYVFGNVKWYNGLPFYFIGAGSCMAAYDIEGTVILENEDGSEED